jgi:hypothetical protein
MALGFLSFVIYIIDSGAPVRKMIVNALEKDLSFKSSASVEDYCMLLTSKKSECYVKSKVIDATAAVHLV